MSCHKPAISGNKVGFSCSDNVSLKMALVRAAVHFFVDSIVHCCDCSALNLIHKESAVEILCQTNREGGRDSLCYPILV